MRARAALAESCTRLAADVDDVAPADAAEPPGAVLDPVVAEPDPDTLSPPVRTTVSVAAAPEDPVGVAAPADSEAVTTDEDWGSEEVSVASLEARELSLVARGVSLVAKELSLVARGRSLVVRVTPPTW